MTNDKHLAPSDVATLERPLDVYLVGICGTGVGALAGLLKQQGHRVRGSDEHVYPPMSLKLQEWGIPVAEGYDEAHLASAGPPPDLVIIGNVIRAVNPEAAYAREHGLRTMSMPQAVAEFGIRDRHSIVIAGTHGKTSVSALTAHVLMSAGRDPGYLVGGALRDYPESFRTGTGPHFVVEGDEYDTAYFDKGPKFLHYRPRTAVITSLEYDHADIFSSIADVERAFGRLVQTVPANGHLVVWHRAELARRQIADHARTSRVTVYATEPRPDANLWLQDFSSGPEGLSFEPVLEGRSLGAMHVPLWGELSARNVLAVIGSLCDAGLSPDELAQGFRSFRGVRRRLELRGEPRGIAVVDDFAHHPTALALTVEAARSRWPARRLWAILEPRNATSRRNVLQSAFVEALATADRVVVSSHERLEEIPQTERFNPAQVATELRGRGVEAVYVPDVDGVASRIVAEAKPGDVLLICSNGSFGGLHDTLLTRLATPSSQQASNHGGRLEAG